MTGKNSCYVTAIQHKRIQEFMNNYVQMYIVIIAIEINKYQLTNFEDTFI